MAKVRIGHMVEAQILEAIEIDYIDESEKSSPLPMMHTILIRPSSKFPLSAAPRDLRKRASVQEAHHDSHQRNLAPEM